MPLNICCPHGQPGGRRSVPHTPTHHRHDGGNRRSEEERDYSGPCLWYSRFLISAYRHILAQNKDEDGKNTLTTDDRKRLTENFAGYDISPDMVRLSRVNMYLHHFTKPKISEYDTLTSEEKWDDCYDVILANPPFMTPKGGIMPHSRYREKLSAPKYCLWTTSPSISTRQAGQQLLSRRVLCSSLPMPIKSFGNIW